VGLPKAVVPFDNQSEGDGRGLLLGGVGARQLAANTLGKLKKTSNKWLENSNF
jgi:hypothetical protein